MKVDTTKVGLVRGVVIYSQWRTGQLSIERAKDDGCHDVGVAYTLWHRHDEDPRIVENELERLSRLYGSFKECDARMEYFEYAPYKS